MFARAYFILAVAVLLAACQQDPRGEVATGTPSATTTATRCAPYVGETPPAVPGARTIDASGLRAMLANGRRPVLVDVASGNERRSVQNAFWLPGAGTCDREAPQTQTRFEAKMSEITGGDRSKPVVVFCPNRSCWLSYNAAVRLVRAGYTDVAWFRDGTDGWAQSGGRLVPVQRAW